MVLFAFDQIGHYDACKHARRPSLMKWLVTAGILAAAIVAVLLPGWIPRDAVYGVDASSTRSAVSKIITIGSPIVLAKDRMQARGFNCLMMYNKPYVGDDRSVAYPPADFLWCDSGDLWHQLLVSKRWQVIFVMKDNAVASIVAGVGLTGL